MRLKPFLFALPLGLVLALIFLVVSEVYRNYPAKDGKLLANGRLLGGDFVIFYLAGKTYRENRKALYDLQAQREYRERYLASASEGLDGELLFVYPPLVALMFSFLSHFEFEQAFYLFAASGFFLGTFALFLLAQDLALLNKASRILLFFALCLAYLPYSVNTVFGGQLAWCGIVVFSLCFMALKRGKDFLAGVVFAFSYYKPPLFFFALLYLFLRRGKKFFLGFVVSGLILTAASVFLLGAQGFTTYLKVISRYTYGQELIQGMSLPPKAGMGLFGLFTTLFSSPALSALVNFSILVGLLYLAYRRKGDFSTLEYAFVVSSSVALSVQCIKYDLAILLVPFVLLAASLETLKGWHRRILAILVLGFYLEFTLRGVPIHGLNLNISGVLFIAWLLIFVVSLLDQPSSAEPTA